MNFTDLSLKTTKGSSFLYGITPTNDLYIVPYFANLYDRLLLIDSVNLSVKAEIGGFCRGLEVPKPAANFAYRLRTKNPQQIPSISVLTLKLGIPFFLRLPIYFKSCQEDDDSFRIALPRAFE